MGLSLAHLRTLEAVARHRSFSRAAEALHLSQPAVSLHVRHLERGLGLSLLDRVGKRALPTPAGDRLLEHAARVFREIESAEEALRTLRGVIAGRVRVGTGATAATYVLPPLFRRLRARYPAMELVVVTGNAAEITAAVVTGELDVAIVTLPVSGRRLAVSPFYRDEIVAIGPPRPVRRRRRALAPADLAAHPLILYEPGGAIRRIIDAWLRRGGVVPRVSMELGNGEAIKQLVAAGLGLSLASAIAVKTEVRAGRLVALPLTPPLSRQLGVVRRRDRRPSPVVERFLTALEEFRRARLSRP